MSTQVSTRNDPPSGLYVPPVDLRRSALPHSAHNVYQLRNTCPPRRGCARDAAGMARCMEGSTASRCLPSPAPRRRAQSQEGRPSVSWTELQQECPLGGIPRGSCMRPWQCMTKPRATQRRRRWRRIGPEGPASASSTWFFLLAQSCAISISPRINRFARARSQPELREALTDS